MGGRWRCARRRACPTTSRRPGAEVRRRAPPRGWTAASDAGHRALTRGVAVVGLTADGDRGGRARLVRLPGAADTCLRARAPAAGVVDADDDRLTRHVVADDSA